MILVEYSSFFKNENNKTTAANNEDDSSAELLKKSTEETFTISTFTRSRWKHVADVALSITNSTAH